MEEEELGLLIEVGTGHGKDSLSHHHGGFTIITFEPNTELYSNIVERTSNMSGYTVINKAVCHHNGTTTLKVSNGGDLSSILDFKDTSTITEQWGDNQDIKYSGVSYEVPTTRLDTFIEENNLQDTEIKFLRIAAQGVDLECLMSVGAYISNVKEGIMCAMLDPEKSLYLNDSNNTVENITQYLQEKNFTEINVLHEYLPHCEVRVHFKK